MTVLNGRHINLLIVCTQREEKVQSSLFLVWGSLNFRNCTLLLYFPLPLSSILFLAPFLSTNTYCMTLKASVQRLQSRWWIPEHFTKQSSSTLSENVLQFFFAFLCAQEETFSINATLLHLLWIVSYSVKTCLREVIGYISLKVYKSISRLGL